MKKLLLSLAFGMGVVGAMAVTPLWMRDVRISPDGRQILFCYKGDIYKVKAMPNITEPDVAKFDYAGFVMLVAEDREVPGAEIPGPAARHAEERYPADPGRAP